MKNINDVYKKLQSSYPDYDITLTDNVITIIVDKYQIKGSDDMICLDENGLEVTHFHCDDIGNSDNYYNEIYDVFVDYIENRTKIKKEIKKEHFIFSLVVFLIILVIAIIKGIIN